MIRAFICIERLLMLSAILFHCITVNEIIFDCIRMNKEEKLSKIVLFTRYKISGFSENIKIIDSEDEENVQGII